ncbi:MAG: radical SAM family heme chaperone HemW [Chloroflexi bacterium]|nr:radical SAM family heme chaperone HemW [Chloroflexota bacterium]
MRADSISLYLHIPFCDHRCAYCDFNAYAGLETLIPAYVDALGTEVRFWAERLGARPVPTVFFGGGTPSLLPLPLLERTLATIRASFAVDPHAEWTIEANPGTVDQAYFRGLRALGINRVSLGVQSFDDGELKRLDRIHDAATAVAAFEAARAAGFDNLSLDLIYGLEGQTLASWRRNVERAIALEPEHLSLYALTIEEGTPLAHRVSKGQAPEPDPDLQADMYELAQERLAAAGYEQYEISNWAKPGRECRHNLVYWRDGEWLGLGAGAHSHIDDVRFAVMNSPAGYIRRLVAPSPNPAPKGEGSPNRERTKSAAPPAQACISPLPFREGGPGGVGPSWLAFSEPQPRPMAMADAAIMALRLSEGLSLSHFESRFGARFEDVYGDTLAYLTDVGMIERTGDRLTIPAHRRLLANEVFARLMPSNDAVPLSVIST